MNYYCPVCNKFVNTIVVKENKDFHPKDCSINEIVAVRRCSICGEELVDVELDDAALKRVYAKADIIRKKMC